MPYSYLPFICVYQWDLLVWVQISALGLKAYAFLSKFKEKGQYLLLTPQKLLYTSVLWKSSHRFLAHLDFFFPLWKASTGRKTLNGDFIPLNWGEFVSIFLWCFWTTPPLTHICAIGTGSNSGISVLNWRCGQLSPLVCTLSHTVTSCKCSSVEKHKDDPFLVLQFWLVSGLGLEASSGPLPYWVYTFQIHLTWLWADLYFWPWNILQQQVPPQTKFMFLDLFAGFCLGTHKSWQNTSVLFISSTQFGNLKFPKQWFSPPFFHSIFLVSLSCVVCLF